MKISRFLFSPLQLEWNGPPTHTLQGTNRYPQGKRKTIDPKVPKDRGYAKVTGVPAAHFLVTVDGSELPKANHLLDLSQNPASNGKKSYQPPSTGDLQPDFWLPSTAGSFHVLPDARVQGAVALVQHRRPSTRHWHIRHLLVIAHLGRGAVTSETLLVEKDKMSRLHPESLKCSDRKWMVGRLLSFLGR